MTTYLVRRLLLMIPTILGVTLVSFLVMQMAPGDPLLSQAGKKGASETSRDAYLIQKRALGLDKPEVLNFNDFRDYGPSVEMAAHFMGSRIEEISQELAQLNAAGDAETKRRRDFLLSLKIPDFEQRLAKPEEHKALAESLRDFVQVWCENAGISAVSAAMSIVSDKQAEVALRRGAIRALSHMLSDPFVYTYSRNAAEDETAAVTATWRLWWERHRDDFHPASAQRTQQLATAFAELALVKTRNEMMEGLEQFRKTDVPFFAEKLLDSESTLTAKNIAAWMLRLYIGKALATTVAVDADQKRVDRVAANWQAYYAAHDAEFQAPLRTKLWHVIADTQYAHLLGRLLTFDFGPSALPTREPVGERIWRAFKVTAPLMLASEALIYIIAVPLGILCAVYRGRFLDRLISFVLFVFYSVPTFVAAMVLMLLFCYGTYARWFPMSGMHSANAGELSWGPWLLDYAWHMFLPMVCLSLFSLAGLAMYARASMLDVISEDYVRTARGKGVSERLVIWRHALRNALIPVITLFADFLPAMLGGSVLIEVLFSIPGMGRLSWSSIEQKDYPTLMALVYIDAIVVLLSILLSDVLYSIVDPRISPAADEESL